MLGDPLVSVVTPAYDAEATLRESVESALSQTEERLELIVVDDGSRVPAAEALEGLDDARLRVVRLPRNRGLSAALNRGLREARGRFFSQLDADDLWRPNYLERVLPRFEDPAVGLVYTNARLVGHPDGQDLYIQDASVHPIDRFPKLAAANPVPCVAGTMRTAAVRAVGGYARWLPSAMDYHLVAKLAVAGWRFTYIDEPLAVYRWPEPDRGMSWDVETSERALLRLWTAFALRHPRVPGPKRQLRLRLRRRLRLPPWRPPSDPP